jgi:hypothetical protein
MLKMLLDRAMNPMHRNEPMLAPDSTFALPQGWLEDSADPIAQMALADMADRHLLRLVLCAAGATLALALAASLA